MPEGDKDIDLATLAPPDLPEPEPEPLQPIEEILARSGDSASGAERSPLVVFEEKWNQAENRGTAHTAIVHALMDRNGDDAEALIEAEILFDPQYKDVRESLLTEMNGLERYLLATGKGSIESRDLDARQGVREALGRVNNAITQPKKEGK